MWVLRHLGPVVTTTYQSNQEVAVAKYKNKSGVVWDLDPKLNPYVAAQIEAGDLEPVKSASKAKAAEDAGES